MRRPVCTSNYMRSTLQHFSLEDVRDWHDKLTTIDSAIRDFVVDNLCAFDSNHGMIPSELLNQLDAAIGCHETLGWVPSTLQAFDGYRVYEFPDQGRIKILAENSDLWYGLAMAEKFGQVHTHHQSDAFNLVLSGHGTFRSDPMDDRFLKNYHNDVLEAGKELEIPIGMSHGHEVVDGDHLWILFVQECGFRQGLRCAGDFHVNAELGTDQR